MEFKGTKGKWIATTSINGRNAVKTIDDDFMFIDTWNARISPKLTEEQARANTVLISKAPEMLEMLKIILSGQFVDKSEIEQLIKEATEL